MSKNKRPAWERLSQVEKIMKDNKPVRIKEQPPSTGWEKCVQEYLERDKERWEQRKKR